MTLEVKNITGYAKKIFFSYLIESVKYFEHWFWRSVKAIAMMAMMMS